MVRFAPICAHLLCAASVIPEGGPSKHLLGTWERMSGVAHTQAKCIGPAISVPYHLPLIAFHRNVASRVCQRYGAGRST